MNIALAIVLLWVVLMQGQAIPTYADQPVVIGVVNPESPAEQAGLRTGDRVLRVNNDDTETWDKFFMAIGTKPDRDVQLTIVRDGREQRIMVRPRGETAYQVGDIGVLPDTYPYIDAVFPGEPAERAGLEAGDQIVSINGQRVVFSGHVQRMISENAGTPIDIVVRRGDGEQTIAVTPTAGASGGRIGIQIANRTRTFRPGPVEAIGLSIQRNFEYSGLILKTIWGLITGETSPRQLVGPVGIAQISGESAQAGWVALFAVMASISLNLGLLNLMPIPVLDGGHILIIGLETVARRDFSIQVKEKMFLAGFALLMALMVTVIYNDLTRISWIERLMPWRN